MQAKQEKYMIFQNINWYLKKNIQEISKIKIRIIGSGNH
jgi:hypothetical protein